MRGVRGASHAVFEVQVMQKGYCIPVYSNLAVSEQ